MKFLERIKGKASETKTKVAVARDKKQVRKMVARLSAVPLCHEAIAYFIIESEVTEYFGRQDCFALDFNSNPTEEEKEAEFENLKILRGQMQVFLEFLFDPSLQYSPSLLKGSINVLFHTKVLKYLDETQMPPPFEESLFIAIIESMIAEASGCDIQDCFTAKHTSNKFDLFTWFQEYRDKFFPNLSFMREERIGREKLNRYLALERISAPFKLVGENNLRSQTALGNPPVQLALETHSVGSGKITKFQLPHLDPIELCVGAAGVVRMIDYYSPFMLEEKHVFSLEHLSIGIMAEPSLDWHFCEGGIIEIQEDVNAKPAWIPAKKVKELVFGEGYDGMSKDGVTQFESYYLYMIVRTSIGPTFTLYKYLAQSTQNAMEAWADLGEESLPMLSDYYNVKISDEVHDVSKHYKTTYTTTWSW